MSTILDSITSPQDIKALSPEECDRLAEEIRQFIISTVAETGGHLASNLGVVELTIALFRVFDFPADKVIWDVGHQSYTYKILTGRKDAFTGLRQWDGLSGFPKREESRFDSFNTGHSSTSISAALGILRASQLLGTQNHVMAIIGDGALTGGMAFEALNDAGQGDDNLIVVLNDNQMSIAHNVGGMEKHLNRLRTSTYYRSFKGKVERFLHRIPGIGKPLAGGLVSLKNWFRRKFMPQENAMFEAFGFRYYGPIDGHDLESLERALRTAAETNGPTLIHICTVKGQGYHPAVSQPQNYHGVAPFEVESGVPNVELVDKTGDSTETFQSDLRRSSGFTDAFSRCLQYFAVRDERVTGICAAMASGTGMEAFGKLFPERFFDVGIAEQHAVALAAGMASGGLRPVVAVYSTFLQRALDQVQHDVVLQNLPVLFCLDRSGVVGEDGETHQGLYDLAYLRALPGGTILAPRDYDELFLMMKTALAKAEGPVIIRYPKGAPLLSKDDFFKIRRSLVEQGSIHHGIERAQWLKRGSDLNLVAWGYTTGLAWQAAAQLAGQGISAGVLDLRSLKPLDWASIEEASLLPIVTIEEIVETGSCSQEICAGLRARENNCRMKSIHIPDQAILQGKRGLVLEQYGISVSNICAEALALLDKERV